MKSVSLFILYLIPSVVRCQTGSNVKDLREKIFVTDGYDKKIRPSNNQSDPTDVYVSFFLQAINGLDEVAETLKTTGYLVVEWKDEFLTWNSTDYGGLEYYHFPQDDVWKPGVALKNSVEKSKPLGDSTLNVRVESTGQVEWFPFEVFKSTCSIDITHFPFDVQTCFLDFVAWSYTKKEVYLMSGSNGINLEEFSVNSEWDLIYSEATVEVEGDSEAAVVYTLQIERKPRYMVLTIILPIAMLSVLNLFVFVLPCDSGEKASYAVTVFLAFAVFLSIISSELPSNSESPSIFSIYIIILTIQSTIITMTALITIRLRQYESPVPNLATRFVGILFCQRCKNDRNSVNPEQFHICSSVENKKRDDFLSNKDNSHQSERPASNTEARNEQEKCDWNTVASALDRFFFCLFSSVTLFSTIGCLIYVSLDK